MLKYAQRQIAPASLLPSDLTTDVTNWSTAGNGLELRLQPETDTANNNKDFTWKQPMQKQMRGAQSIQTVHSTSINKHKISRRNIKQR